MMRLISGFVCTMVFVAILACSKDGGGGPLGASIPKDLASCATSKDQFTVSPIAISAINGWVPLGNLNPPAHTFPTDHQYIYLKVPNSVEPLVAPGNIVVTRAKSTKYSTGTTGEYYSIGFQPCR